MPVPGNSKLSIVCIVLHSKIKLLITLKPLYYSTIVTVFIDCWKIKKKFHQKGEVFAYPNAINSEKIWLLDLLLISSHLTVTGCHCIVYLKQLVHLLAPSPGKFFRRRHSFSSKRKYEENCFVTEVPDYKTLHILAFLPIWASPFYNCKIPLPQHQAASISWLNYLSVDLKKLLQSHCCDKYCGDVSAHFGLFTLLTDMFPFFQCFLWRIDPYNDQKMSTCSRFRVLYKMQ